MSHSKIGQHPPSPHLSPFNVRVELLVNSWVGGQAEGGRPGNNGLCCCMRESVEGERESQADDRVKEVSVYAGK